MENNIKLFKNIWLQITRLQCFSILFFLATITPLIYSPLLASGANLPRFKLIALLSSCASICFLFYLYKMPQWSFNKLFLIPLTIFIWSCISLFWSIDIGNSLIQISYFFSSLLILFLAMQVQFFQKRIIINGAIISCFLVSIIGLLQVFNFNPFNIHYNSIPASTFVNKNHASIFVEFFIPVLLIFLMYTNSIRSKFIYSAVLTLSISFLYILSSFGTLVSIFLSLMLSGFILSRNSNLLITLKINHRYLIAILICSTIITSFANLTTTQQSKSFTSITHKSTHTQRLAVYEKGLTAIIDNPLTGFGYGAFRAGILPYISEVQSITKHNEYTYYREAHNDFLQQFLETGIFSGILFISFFLLVLYLGLSSLNNTKVSEKNIFIFSISSGLLVLFLHAFIDFPFHLSASNFLIYLTSGFILSVTAKKRIFNKTILFQTMLLVSLVCFITILIASSYYNLKHIQSNKLIRDTAIADIKENNCEKAIKLIDRSNQIFRFDFQSQKTQAYVYKRCRQPLDKQRVTIDKLIKLSSANFIAHFLRGDRYLLENKSKLAFLEYYYILTMLPDRAIGYNGMAKWAIINHKYEDAQIYLKKANILEPENPETKYLLEYLSSSGKLK